jgi:archaemetzincin
MRLLSVAVMGTVDEGAMAAIEGSLAAAFATPLARFQLPDPEFAFDPGRAQYGSVPVLRSLAAHRPPTSGKLLGVTARDLFIPMLTFVFGQAQVDGGVAVVSLARLRQEFYGMPGDRELLAARARKEALHETGHMFGLVHCADRTCAMALATNIGQLDGKRAAFCATCTALLDRRRRSLEGLER